MIEENYIEVPYTSLSKEALSGLLEAWLLEEYDVSEASSHKWTLKELKATAEQQLIAGESLIVFNKSAESFSIVTTEEFRSHKKKLAKDPGTWDPPPGHPSLT